MSVIYIPKVSLVDLTGCVIAPYSDDPEWWRKFELTKRKETSIKISNMFNSINESLLENKFETENLPLIGETLLHIAIVFDDIKSVKYLIEKKGFDVNLRSSGEIFSPIFDLKLISNLISNSKYEKLAYYGEFPLAFAACFSNKEIYDYMIEKGADPNVQGN